MVSKAHSLVQRPRQKPVTKKKDTQPASPAESVGTEDSPPVNILHLELFHHFITDLLTFFGFDKFPWGDSAMEMTKCALTAPYLMNQILALSALHLSITRTDDQQSYHRHAAQLQTHALSEFNRAKLDLNPQTCLPMFLFSSILALHVLCDNLLFRPSDFETFLENFIQSLKMHRGVRAVTNQSWHILLQSPLKSFLDEEGKTLDAGVTGDECTELLSLVNITQNDQEIRSIYQTTIEHLQKAFNGSRSTSAELRAVGPIISWPVIIPPGYIDLLSERRPEALAILSYFGALLHLHKEMWTFGDSGIYLISSINNCLGPSWRNWLRWPNDFISSDPK
ncbi:unnamed protein product [Penicillium olsonii]|nr:unnamed protein product [Penicillium olsonii]